MMYLVFLGGLALGSFLNVVIYRTEKGKRGIFSGRSECPSCGHKLVLLDLIPLLSFLLIRGRCRYCRKSISFQYPLVELATALLFVFLYLKFGFTLLIVCHLLLATILIILFVYDLKTQTIPDLIAWIGIGVAVILALFRGLSPTTNYQLLITAVLGAAIAGGFFTILVYISGEKWMGKGDIKLGVLIGMALGFPNILVSLFFAFILGALFGIILVFLKKKGLKSQIPFGPFLIASFYIAVFLGERILNWYSGAMR